MCGLAGLFDPRHVLETDRLLPLANAMAAPLFHRGPDDGGSWQDAPSGIAFGFRRLAIIDTSASGHQPMEAASGRYVIVFNGEIYNFLELRQSVEPQSWRGHSDTEVLLALIDRFGVEDTVAKLDGMFAFALWDRAKQRLTLARDRFGEKPLYYGWVGGVFAFASELSGLAPLPGWPPALDPVGVALYLRHGWIPAPRSIFEGVSKLLPGHVLNLDADRRDGKLSRYWSSLGEAVSAAETFRGDEVATTDELDRRLRQSIKRRLIADVPLGAFLSGGIDSSTVVALMADMGAKPRAFTIGFPDSDKDEAPHAAAVAAHVGADHTVVPMTERDCLAVVPDLPGIYAEPFADTSQIPTALLCRVTRPHVVVALSGDGGDELFGGYGRYGAVTAQWARCAALPGWVRGLAGRAERCLSGNEWPPLRRLRRKLRPLAGTSPDDLYRDALSWWHDDDGLIAAGGLNDGGIWRDATRILDGLNSLPARFMALDMALYLPDDLETKMDRAAMAASLEVRAPLLDHELARFAWSLPLDLKLRAGRGKHLLREVLYRYVPPAIIDRPKQGFDPPLQQWLRGPLRDWADDLIGSDALACDGLIDPHPVRRRWAEHRAGRRNWSFQLWIVLMLLAWRARTARSVPKV